MEFVRIQEDGSALQITTIAPIVWDENNYCTAEALWKDGKSEQFNVFPLTVIDEPSFDAMTQKCFRDGCELVNGEWRYKWTIQELTADEVLANQIAKANADLAAKKAARQAAVDAITVTVDGLVFDGDEVSQGRMARAIVVMQAASIPTISWVLHDNTVATVTVAQLTQALAAAGAEQARLWVQPYEAVPA